MKPIPTPSELPTFRMPRDHHTPGEVCDLCEGFCLVAAARPMPYGTAKERFIAWANENAFDPTCSELREAFIAGIECSEAAQGIKEEA
jgi:hypothetical protein